MNVSVGQFNHSWLTLAVKGYLRCKRAFDKDPEIQRLVWLQGLPNLGKIMYFIYLF